MACGEHGLAGLGGPSDVVAVQVGEDDIGDGARSHAEGGQALEQAAGRQGGVVRPGSGVDQGQVAGAADEESPELERQISLRVEEMAVRLPPTWRNEALVRRPVAADVMDACDLESTQLHLVSSPGARPARRLVAGEPGL